MRVKKAFVANHRYYKAGEYIPDGVLSPEQVEYVASQGFVEVKTKPTASKKTTKEESPAKKAGK